MKKFTKIAVSLLTIFSSFFISCGGNTDTNVTPTSDTTFSGSYFQIVYNSNNFTLKSATIEKVASINTLTTETAGNTYIVELFLGQEGISNATLEFTYSGIGTGTFPITSEEVIQISPFSEYTGDTTGSVSITYSGADYIQGTFTTTLINSGQSYPTIGSFKIYH